MHYRSTRFQIIKLSEPEILGIPKPFLRRLFMVWLVTVQFFVVFCCCGCPVKVEESSKTKVRSQAELKFEANSNDQVKYRMDSSEYPVEWFRSAAWEARTLTRTLQLDNFFSVGICRRDATM